MDNKVFTYALLAMFAFGLIVPFHAEKEKKGEGNIIVVGMCVAAAPMCIGIILGASLMKYRDS